MFRQSLLSLFALLLCSTGHTQPKRKPVKVLYPVTIQFQHVVDTQLLHIDSTYTNPHREAFTVKNFRYYISHISVTNAQGKTQPLPLAYYLVDERKPESKIISLLVPYQSIKAISFSIGIDSSKNVSGVQTGALDPANGMFWTWNSGYIFAKLEGSSPVSSAPQNGFTYHIGGFRTGENALRKVSMALPKPVMLAAKKMATITITANLNAWFTGRNTIKISEQPFTMSPGKLAMQIADNYSRMFSIIKSD